MGLGSGGGRGRGGISSSLGRLPRAGVPSRCHGSGRCGSAANGPPAEGPAPCLRCRAAPGPWAPPLVGSASGAGGRGWQRPSLDGSRRRGRSERRGPRKLAALLPRGRRARGGTEGSGRRPDAVKAPRSAQHEGPAATARGAAFARAAGGVRVRARGRTPLRRRGGHSRRV